jgi:hypothetical protein
VRGADTYHTLVVPDFLDGQIIGIQDLTSSAGVTQLVYSEAILGFQTNTRKGL